MPVTEEQFDYLLEEVCKAEDVVRIENPEFVSGFHAISLQGHRIEFTLERLRAVKANLKDSEKILLDNIAELRTANPNQKPKGTAYARRVLRDKPLWQKVVSAHTLRDGDKENIHPNLSDDDDSDEGKLTKLSEALKGMSAKDAKVEFEQHDYSLRHKLEGIKKLTTLVGYYIGLLTPRLRKLEHLEGIGRKWTERIFEASDIERIEKAQKEITDGAFEVKAISAVLDIFPEDFTQLCELDDIGRGMKRKVEWIEDLETPETMKKDSNKKICTKATCSKSKKTRHIL